MAKGLFRPANPQKYLGDPTKIAFRSSWELAVMEMFDANENILNWASEEVKIPYFSPVKNRPAMYIPDFFVRYRDKDGNIIQEIIEVKPRKETRVTAKSSLYDRLMVAVNTAKWQAAVAYCEKHGIKFRVLTEHELFRQKPKKK